jgi:large subunit ribosomal protein L1
MAGKKYNKLKEKLPTTSVTIEEGITWLKTNVESKVDPTVEVHVHLGIDPEKSDQMVRSFVVFPSGSPKQKKIAVFVEDTGKQAEAKKAGASIVGGSALIEEIVKKGSLDADMTIATPDMMPKIAKVARILGPKGLMPNPKTGTVTPDPVTAIKELASGKSAFKMDTLGNIHEPVAKLSWEEAKIAANVQALLDAIRAAKPSSVKGQYISTVSLKSTMSPAIRISL